VVILLRGGLPLRYEERLGIGDRWSMECGRGRRGIRVRRGLQWMARPPLSIYHPPFAASIGLQTAFVSPDEAFSPFVTLSFTHHQSLRAQHLYGPYTGYYPKHQTRRLCS